MELYDKYRNRTLINLAAAEQSIWQDWWSSNTIAMICIVKTNTQSPRNFIQDVGPKAGTYMYELYIHFLCKVIGIKSSVLSN